MRQSLFPAACAALSALFAVGRDEAKEGDMFSMTVHLPIALCGTSR